LDKGVETGTIKTFTALKLNTDLVRFARMILLMF